MNRHIKTAKEFVCRIARSLAVLFFFFFGVVGFSMTILMVAHFIGAAALEDIFETWVIVTIIAGAAVGTFFLLSDLDDP